MYDIAVGDRKQRVVINGLMYKVFQHEMCNNLHYSKILDFEIIDSIMEEV